MAVKQPFKNATALLDFLEADEPELYVFRGQIRAYEGPMLPSGLRDRFIPFDVSKGPSEWAGITKPVSVIKDEINIRRRDLSSTFLKGEDVDDGKTTWDLPDAAYQTGFRDFFNQPHSHIMRDLGNVLRESAVPAISAIFGSDLGDMLCQQYGLTSQALDVSTDPSVAMFFATHRAPFYNLVADSSYPGVVYRWPRERATIAQDLLLPLESSDFESITTSFRNFIKGSVDLVVTKDTQVRYTLATGEFQFQKRMMGIVSEGERRNISALCFPAGAFDRSRIGRQRAALLWPDFKLVKVLEPRYDRNSAALIGDLMKTHQGEVFYFRQTGASMPERLNKFALWPSIRPINDGLVADFRLELQRGDHVEFEDLYFEMMLRFFSSCGPCYIIVGKLLEPGNRQSLHGFGVAHGVVNLAYQLQPSDAGFIANRLRNSEIYTPIPTLRYIPAEHMESFQAAFADAIAS